MKEIQHYDRAAHKFYQKQSFNALPLTSWDLFAEEFQTIGDALNDVFILKKLAETNNWNSTVSFEEEILKKNHVVVITDESLNIVHSSKNIFKMNGYSSEEIIGRKPKMFQGELTCKETAHKIGKAVANKIPFEATILNYRKDGSTYNCWIKGAPIKDKNGNVVNFIAFEREVA
ncbi:PAS domain-containing protein [Croceitalea sp. MTPC9]|uniref:PAS domain-containing protein n=1 Tax=unclassified Croceitalea TaxID=2632280 RepID=UPI002B36FFF4|nr:PAS domain-containing protein [Croceitalea sp. MTPC6]GMN16744.1 PAS domain-containing protein [Croceitalea sp. MTPC9]